MAVSQWCAQSTIETKFLIDRSGDPDADIDDEITDADWGTRQVPGCAWCRHWRNRPDGRYHVIVRGCCGSEQEREAWACTHSCHQAAATTEETGGDE